MSRRLYCWRGFVLSASTYSQASGRQGKRQSAACITLVARMWTDRLRIFAPTRFEVTKPFALPQSLLRPVKRCAEFRKKYDVQAPA